jgi:hypothetical protein
VEDATGVETDASSHLLVNDRWFEDPPVQVPAPSVGHFADCRLENLRSEQAHFVSMMGMDDQLE